MTEQELNAPACPGVRYAPRYTGSTGVTGPRRMTHPFFQDRIAAPMHALVRALCPDFRDDRNRTTTAHTVVRECPRYRDR